MWGVRAYCLLAPLLCMAAGCQKKADPASTGAPTASVSASAAAIDPTTEAGLRALTKDDLEQLVDAVGLKYKGSSRSSQEDTDPLFRTTAITAEDSKHQSVVLTLYCAAKREDLAKTIEGNEMNGKRQSWQKAGRCALCVEMGEIGETDGGSSPETQKLLERVLEAARKLRK